MNVLCQVWLGLWSVIADAEALELRTHELSQDGSLVLEFLVPWPVTDRFDSRSFCIFRGWRLGYNN